MRWIFKRDKGHIGLESLSEHLDGCLPAAEAEKVESHLESCLQCREEFESLQYTVKLLNRVPEVSPRRVFTLDVAPEPALAPVARGLRVPAWSYGAAASVAVMLFVAVLSADLTGSLEGEPRVPDVPTLAVGAPSETTDGAQPAITPSEPGSTEEAAPAPSEEDQRETELAESQEEAATPTPSDGTSAEAAAAPIPALDPTTVPPSAEDSVAQAAPAPAEPSTPTRAFGDFAKGQEETPTPETQAGITVADDAAVETESIEAAPPESVPAPDESLEATPAPEPPTPTSTPTQKPFVTQEFAVETAITAGSEALPEAQVSDETGAAEATAEAVAAAPPQLVGGGTTAFWRILEGVSAGVAVLLVGWFFLRVVAARRRSVS